MERISENLIKESLMNIRFLAQSESVSYTHLMAQAGGKNPAGAKDAVEAAKTILEGQLK